MPRIQRAIVSVTDKAGVVDFCRVLVQYGVEILSTGGTSKVLREAEIPVVDVAEFTGSPEILDGRLKTLHPKIEGGILGIRSNSQHQTEMKDHGILPIDLVVVNLYPFEATVSKSDCTLEHAIENIDIGGPTMLRAAAKNHQDVTVITDVADYVRVADEMRLNKGSVSAQTNFELAVKVFQTTARYDAMISNYLYKTMEKGTFAESFNMGLSLVSTLRYGENPHQKAAVYREPLASAGAIVNAKQLHGKELSFNNYIDLEAAYAVAAEFDDAACAIIKHTNPCGTALGKTISEAFERARAADPVSAFGGIVGLNRIVDVATAKLVGETFFECIVAPGFEPEALEILKAKKNIRLMELPAFGRIGAEIDIKRVSGGLLVQERDLGKVDLRKCDVPTKRKPTDDELAELDFAWKLCKHVKSNAIVFTKGRQSVGVGAGQMSRVDSAKIAASKANQSLKGAVVASDAFFPFRDGLDEIARHGITAVIQPGGSVKDPEVIAAADEHGIAMVFTGMRHFKH